PDTTEDLVGSEEAGGQAHGRAHEGAAVHAELLRFLLGHFAGQALHPLLPARLRPRDDLLVAEHLGRQRGIDPLQPVSIYLADPHEALLVTDYTPLFLPARLICPETGSYPRILPRPIRNRPRAPRPIAGARRDRSPGRA